MITEILDQIPELAVMYLVNAVAFDAEWETPYDEEPDTGCHILCGGRKRAGGFHDVRYHVPLSDHGTCQGAFAGLTRRAMTLWRCFRRKGLSLSKWLEELDGETFHETIRQENDTMIETGLPQFTGETDLELKDTLMALGMPLAFDEKQADFFQNGVLSGRKKY